MAVTLTWRGIVFAGGLSAMAGFVDAVAYIHLGGYFVSFMSGNSTRASADLAQGALPGAALALGLVVSFVAGVMIGMLLTRLATKHQRTISLVIASTLLLLSALAGLWPHTEFLTPPFLAAAMGATNTSYTRNGEVSVGLTYMTGALVKLGQHLTSALTGGSKTHWLRYLLLWLMISAGAVVGAHCYQWFGLTSLFIASCALVLWTALSFSRTIR